MTSTYMIKIWYYLEAKGLKGTSGKWGRFLGIL